jgi:hypothetical protein
MTLLPNGLVALNGSRRYSLPALRGLGLQLFLAVFSTKNHDPHTGSTAGSSSCSAHRTTHQSEGVTDHLVSQRARAARCRECCTRAPPVKDERHVSKDGCIVASFVQL